MHKPFDFMIGADPEFTLTVQDKRVDAAQTMKQIFQRIELSEEFRPGQQGFDVGNFGNIGWDGASQTAEIRPNAGNTPKAVTENIRQILTAAYKHLNIFNFSTLSLHAPIGGHIILDIPPTIRFNHNIAITNHRRLASFYLPILLSENQISFAIRIKSNYGSLQDFRIEMRRTADGRNINTYEIRCPSPEWMITPKLAEATLAYIAVIYHEIVHHPNKFKKFGDIVFKNIEQGNALQVLALTSYNPVTRQLIQRIRHYIKNFEMYPEYKAEVDFVLKVDKVVKEKVKAQYDIAIGWGLSQQTTVTKKDILSDKKVKEIANSKNIEQFRDLLAIHYNNDLNTATFADKLAERVMALNWKLKHTYLLFGMRKGIKDIIAQDFSEHLFKGKELIKTTSDYLAVGSMFEKMWEKFNGYIRQGYTIDFSSPEGKLIRTSDSCVCIGIPYEMRVNKEYKEFLELIWDIEQGKRASAKFNKTDLNRLTDDSHVPTEQKGEIARAFISTPKVVLDNGMNQSSERARAAIEELGQEQEQEAQTEANITQTSNPL